MQLALKVYSYLGWQMDMLPLTRTADTQFSEENHLEARRTGLCQVPGMSTGLHFRILHQ